MKLEKFFTNAYHLIVVGNFHFSGVLLAMPPSWCMHEGGIASSSSSSSSHTRVSTPPSSSSIHPVPSSFLEKWREACWVLVLVLLLLIPSPRTGIERNDHCENIHIIH